ncbi:MAG TPA: glycerol kinase [Elusimicrobia bacterium]|nr:glycerol kinase [Elusimicrobiota bacterium]
MECVIALDQGSSTTRALAVDERGRVVAAARRPIRTFRPRPGIVEHDPLELAESSEAVLDAVLSKLPKKAAVLGLGLSAQRSTVVFWDAGTGEPVGRAPSWQDGRAAALLVPLQGRQQEVHERTGLYLTPFYSAPKIRFLLDSEPELKRRADAGTLRIGPVTTWLLWRLTRGGAFAVDPTMAQRMLLMDLGTMSWDDGLLSLFGVPREALPRIRSTTGEWAVLERGGRRFPVLATLGDQQAAAVGQGAGQAGSGVLNYGTGAFYLQHAGTQTLRVPGLLTTLALQRQNAAPEFFLEGTVHAAGTSYDWLKENLGLLKDVRKVDALCRESTERLWVLQSIGGLGAPRWDYRTPAAVLGLSARTRPADLVRGVTEALAFLVADIVGAVRKAGLEPVSLKASGGVSKIDYLMQFQADLLQKGIHRLHEGEATALGAAALAAEKAGAPWARKLADAGVDREFIPRMEPERARRLHAGWLAFVAGQQRLAEELRALGAL